jgi:D-alanyl-D-alanine dipeptidase
VRLSVLSRVTFGAVIAALVLPLSALARKPPANESDFANLQSVDRTIAIDLRYAGSNNVTHRAIYPTGTSALLRANVAQRLAIAQKYLKAKGYGLKIWDAYRPAAAQQQLWLATHNRSFVADPTGGVGSMHTRGAAVDATLVDSSGAEVAMPTDFDNFTPAAMIAYQGGDPVVRSNLKLLQKAMAHAGFYGLRTEWWHFCAPDWKKYPQVPELKIEPEKKKWWFL